MGCASYRWEKAGSTPQEFSRDSYQCELQALQAAPYRSELVPITNRDLTTSYMTTDGNRHVRDRLIEQCLRARGWQLLRVN